MDSGKIKKILVVVIVSAVFLWLRLYRIEERMNFSMDQGMFMLRAREIWDKKELVLIGPPASPIVEGRHFFQGPITYYWLVILGVLGNWDPVKITWLITLMSLVSMGFLYLTTVKLFGKKVGILSIYIWTLLPIAIDFSGWIWNPSLLLILVPPMLYMGIVALKEKKWWQFGVWGILLGWGLQCHFQAGLLLILTAIIMILKRIKISGWLFTLGGFLIGYSPLIIFDLRNNFYNLKTIFEWMGQRGGGFELQQFYFLEFLPILVILVAKIFYKWRIVLLGGLIMFLGWTITNEKQAKGMPMEWNYGDLKKTSVIIKNKAGNEFNVVNLLSGDTRFYPLRYLLTVENKVPMQVEKYNKELWVISYKNYDFRNSTVWELEKAKNMKLRSRTEINLMVELVKFKEI